MSKVAEYNPRELADLLLRPIVTEKATMLLEQNKYVFEVVHQSHQTRNSKQLLKAYLRSKLRGVNTARPPRKKRRVGKFQGYKPTIQAGNCDFKLKGDSITLFPEV